MVGMDADGDGMNRSGADRGDAGGCQARQLPHDHARDVAVVRGGRRLLVGDRKRHSLPLTSDRRESTTTSFAISVGVPPSVEARSTLRAQGGNALAVLG